MRQVVDARRPFRVFDFHGRVTSNTAYLSTNLVSALTRLKMNDFTHFKSLKS